MIELEMQNQLAVVPAFANQAKAYGVRIPEGGTYPNAALTRISSERVRSMTGPSGLNRARVQVDCRAYDYRTAKSLADLVRRTFDGVGSPAAAMWGIYRVQSVQLQDEHDTHEPPEFADDRATFRTQLDFYIWYEEPTS